MTERKKNYKKKSIIRRLLYFKTDIGIVAILALYIMVIYPNTEPSIKLIDTIGKSEEYMADQINDTLTIVSITFSNEFKNYSLKPGFIDSLNIETTSINPLMDANKDRIKATIKYVDKKNIGFFETEHIKYCILLYCRNYKLVSKIKSFRITFFDNVGNLILFNDKNEPGNFYFRQKLN